MLKYFLVSIFCFSLAHASDLPAQIVQIQNQIDEIEDQVSVAGELKEKVLKGEPQPVLKKNMLELTRELEALKEKRKKLEKELSESKNLIITAKGSGHAEISPDVAKLSAVLKSYLKSGIKEKIFPLKNISIDIDVVQLYVKLLKGCFDDAWDLLDNFIKSEPEKAKKTGTELNTEQVLKELSRQYYNMLPKPNILSDVVNNFSQNPELKKLDFNTLFDLYKLSHFLDTPILELAIVKALGIIALESKDFINQLCNAIEKKQFSGFAGQASKIFIKQTEDSFFNFFYAQQRIKKVEEIRSQEKFILPMAMSPTQNIIAILSQIEPRKNYGEMTVKHEKEKSEVGFGISDFYIGKVEIYRWFNPILPSTKEAGWKKVASIILPVEKGFKHTIPLSISFNANGKRLVVLAQANQKGNVEALDGKSAKQFVYLIDSSSGDCKNWKVIANSTNQSGNISACSFSTTDPDMLITGTTNGVIEILSTKAGKFAKNYHLYQLNKPVMKILCCDKNLYVHQGTDLLLWILENKKFKFLDIVNENVKLVSADGEGQLLALQNFDKTHSFDILKFSEYKFKEQQSLRVDVNKISLALNYYANKLAYSVTYANGDFLFIERSNQNGEFERAGNLQVSHQWQNLKITNSAWNEIGNTLILSFEREFGYLVYMFAWDLDKLPVIQLWLLKILNDMSATEEKRRRLAIYVRPILAAIDKFPTNMQMAIIEKYNLKP